MINEIVLCKSNNESLMYAFPHDHLKKINEVTTEKILINKNVHKLEANLNKIKQTISLVTKNADVFKQRCYLTRF